jgi:integrase
MALRRRVINGKPTWVIDRRFRTENGSVRYRRAAQVQTRAGADAEERRLQNYFAEHGTIAPFLETLTRKPLKKVEPKVFLWEDAVDYYKKHVLPLHEPSTRKSYRVLLAGAHMKHWSGTPLCQITRASLVEWDAKVKQSGVSPSTRRNHHCVLRSVLRAVGPHDGESGLYLETLPSFPALPKVGRTEVGAVPEEDIRVLLGERPKGFHFKTWTLFGLAVALSAFAGLRSSEIRALRHRDVDLVAGVITVRLKRCVDEEGPPKSQHQRAIDFHRTRAAAAIGEALPELEA